MIRPPPISTLFPYTTLFRSVQCSPSIRISAISRTRSRHVWMSNGDSSVARSEEHTSELQSRFDLVCRLLLEKKKDQTLRRFEEMKIRINDTDIQNNQLILTD